MGGRLAFPRATKCVANVLRMCCECIGRIKRKLRRRLAVQSGKRDLISPQKRYILSKPLHLTMVARLKVGGGFFWRFFFDGGVTPLMRKPLHLTMVARLKVGGFFFLICIPLFLISGEFFVFYTLQALPLS
jgi:hypothetical protein